MSEAEKIQRIEQLIREWDGKTGHDRCWYYPDLFQQIAGILGVELTQTPELPRRAEFEEGCRRYQQQEYQWPGITSEPGNGCGPSSAISHWASR